MDATNGNLEEPLYSYTMSSMDMRYIEIGRRDIYLHSEPYIGLIFRGKISGCGPSCFADLNELLLEFSLSCEGCRDDDEVRAKVSKFGHSLAEILVKNTPKDWNDLPATEKLIHVFSCVLNSMNAQFKLTETGSFLEYTLDYCPLRDSARNTGLDRGIELAQYGFISLCNRILELQFSDWVLQKPLEHEAGLPLTKIIIALN